VDKINSRIAQVYGYAVCLICVIVILVSAHSVIDAAFDYVNPEASGTVSSRMSAPTYETYRIQNRRGRANGPGQLAPTDTTVSEQDLRKAFDSEKAEAISSAKFRALRSLVSSSVFLVLALIFFLLHWRWVRRTNKEPLTG
jgi:hypothetical protein